jgi:uncharacterized protein with beta-barrel porin domain
MTNVWACPSGVTTVGRRFRYALLGTVAVGALSLACGGPALAGNCTTVGSVATCTGDNSAGITNQGGTPDFTSPPVTTLNVNNLNQAISTPATAGINFSSAGGITITSDTGAFGIITTGAGSSGIAAGSSAGPVTVTSTGNITTAGNAGTGIYAGGAGAGPVTVTSTGNITTAGNAGTGIYAGGAGAGAVTVTSTGNIATGGVSAVGISARDTGAGAVTVTSTGNITTTGKYAHGIVAYGNGAVTVTSIGNISTAGRGAAGIAANGAGAGTVTSTGNITAAGSGSFGISARSVGPIVVTIESGTVSGGSGTGAGVVLADGTTNTLTNMGTLTALSGLAIKGNTGNNTVNNLGTVVGNVILGSGANAFNNMAGGIFNAGPTVNLGAGNALTNAGTLSPGGTGVMQTTALTGNLAQSATGRLALDVNAANGTSDRVNVSGTANLGGAVQLQVSNLSFAPWQATVLSATGGTTNNGLTLLASPALQAQLVFPNATDLVLKSAGINFVVAGLGTNQAALGNVLNGVAQTAGLGLPVFNVLLNGVTSLPAYNAALNQLSGEAATGTQQATFSAMNNFMGTMLEPFNRGTTSTPASGVSGYAAEGDASAYASDGRKRSGAERDAYAMFTKAPPQNFEARWNVWAAGFGGSQTTDGNAAAGSNGSTSHIAGTAIGADYLFSPNTIAGFALAGGGTSYTVGNGLGSGRSDLFQAGVYARHTIGQAYIAGALAYGWQDITTNRTVTLVGLDQLQARFNANAYSGRVEGGYRFVTPWIGGIGITPYAAAQFTTFDLPAYAEQAIAGTNNFALAYGAKSVTDPRSELGFRADKSYVMQDGVLTLRGRLAWAHDYDPDRAIGATFQTLPGASFVVNGAPQASDSVLTTASIERKWINNWSIAATFEGEFSNVTSSYAGKGVVRYQW